MASALYLANLIPSQTATSTVTGSAVDLQDFDGEAYLTINCGQATAGTNPTATFTLTQCATSGGVYTAVTLNATPTVVTGVSGATNEIIAFRVADIQRYVKGVCTIGGTSTPTFSFSVNVVGRKQVQA
jgi:hypothetical protein